MVYYNGVMFSKDECKDILNSVTEFATSGLDVVVNGIDYGWAADEKKRKSAQCKLIATSDSLVYKRMNEIITKCGYKLKSTELDYDVVRYNEGDFIWKHRDDKGQRLLSFVAQLGESDSYDGGDFLYWIDNTEFSMDRTIGNGMAFKAGVYHEVKPITKGTRYSFVAFIKYSDIEEINGKGLI